MHSLSFVKNSKFLCCGRITGNPSLTRRWSFGRVTEGLRTIQKSSLAVLSRIARYPPRIPKHRYPEREPASDIKEFPSNNGRFSLKLDMRRNAPGCGVDPKLLVLLKQQSDEI